MIGKKLGTAATLAVLALELSGCARNAAALQPQSALEPPGALEPLVQPAGAGAEPRLGEEPDALPPVINDVYDKSIPEDVYSAD
ncbi:hypothetical protein [Paenibacillus glufosinatiresistens]|uniref:hypothetical protein n=1 Tax=Paenibacillus glufosinatiresistens TaxID=3070657 RepID=UPI00286E7005|nr:hypothetical protein [Paenibacillus sp. YX.27]